MSERTIEKARQVVHRLSEWYFAEGGDNDPDSPIDREDLDALHDLVRTAEASARRELEASGGGEDVRERIARECVEEAERLGRWYGEGYAKARSLLREAAALLLTPRGDEAAWRAFLDALDEVETAAASLWADPDGPTADDVERLDQARQRVIECARAIAGRRSDAQGEEDVGEVCDLCGEMFDPSELGTVIGPLGQDDGVPRWYRCPRCARAYDAGYQQGQRDPRGDEIADPTAIRSDADALDLIRWAEARAVALEPVAGNIMPPGTYACYAGDADEPYMGPGILGAIRAARRSEGGINGLE